MSAPPPSLFASYWQAGFESACHINLYHSRLDMIAALQHDKQACTDYGLLKRVGIRTARDGIRWHLIDRDGQYDFSSLVPMAEAAELHGIQVIWNLCHYGWPEEIDLFSPEFVDRFTKFSGAVARFFRERGDGVPFYTPVNEISFMCYAATRKLMFPYAVGRANELKRQLVRATFAACEAVWDVDPRARFVYPEPIIHIVPSRDRMDLAQEAEFHTNSMFEAWDMIAGMHQPELGGDPKYLDIVGCNFYWNNEWEHKKEPLGWDEKPLDPRWRPLSEILAQVYHRYRKPLFLAETSHVGIGRPGWIRGITDEVVIARQNGIPVDGICLYPILDRFDWDNADHWHNSGLWDLTLEEDGCLRRVLNQPYASALFECQLRLAQMGCV